MLHSRVRFGADNSEVPEHQGLSMFLVRTDAPGNEPQSISMLGWPEDQIDGAGT